MPQTQHHWSTSDWRLQRGFILLLALMFGLTALTTSAQETPSAAASAAPSEAVQTAIPIDPEMAGTLEAKLEQMRSLGAAIRGLDEQLKTADGLQLKILEVRVTRYWNELIDVAHSLAREVLALEEKGSDVSAYKDTVITVLSDAPSALLREIDRTNTGVKLPEEGQTPAEQSAVDASSRMAIDRVTSLYRALLDNIELARKFGIDSDSVEAELNARLEETAASVSAFLDLSIANASAARSQLASLPTDTNIAALLAVADNRVALLSDVLKEISRLMTRQALDTSLYDAQIIATTGEITADILDVSLIGGLLRDWFDSVRTWFVENAGGMAFSLIVFVAILVISFKLADLVQKLIIKALASSHVQVSQLLHRMVVSTTRSVIIAVGLLVALSQLGISLGPLLAGLGIAGFVIGFALQDTLSNFASGLMILFYRPFDVGDVVEVGAGVFGTVNHMSLVNTTILTFDNQTLVVPNNSIWQNVIKNVTAQRTRRIDLVFGIGYSDDIPKAEKILTAIVEGHAAVLKDPEPIIRLHELGDSSVNFVVRPWVKTDDYWDVYWDITREVKMRFDAEGVSIPFPQRDVHLFTETPLLAATVEPAGPA